MHQFIPSRLHKLCCLTLSQQIHEQLVVLLVDIMKVVANTVCGNNLPLETQFTLCGKIESLAIVNSLGTKLSTGGSCIPSYHNVSLSFPFPQLETPDE